MPRYIFTVLIIALLFTVSCRPRIYPPKPAGYFRIDTPETHQYKLFSQQGFPYTFEYPSFGIIQKDTVFRKDGFDNRFWINVYFPSMNAVINITYKEFHTHGQFDSLVSDAYGLSFFHHEKADYIDEKPFQTPYAIGVLYTVGGNSASRYQFTATDTTKNFIRGALYFDVTPNADSLKPATDFLAKDIEHMLATLKWQQAIEVKD